MTIQKAKRVLRPAHLKHTIELQKEMHSKLQKSCVHPLDALGAYTRLEVTGQPFDAAGVGATLAATADSRRSVHGDELNHH